MLFILAIDPLQNSMEEGSSHPAVAKLRTSLYADDAAIFPNPTPTKFNRLGTSFRCSRGCHWPDHKLPGKAQFTRSCPTSSGEDWTTACGLEGTSPQPRSWSPRFVTMPTYHLTIFPLAKWARQIDKIRRSFLWKGEENANGGRKIGRLVDPKIWVVLASSTSTSLGALLDSGGFGKSGRMPQSLGRDFRCHATSLIAAEVPGVNFDFRWKW
ncbi:hypothetical protein U9M48_037605 [Paspalum notatum var. saurae]|uniref:Uncharacterized protein n=1 Tax=Paspalum notatum var. saurae TaxID=547442 RepID=A0AAQ3XAU0_PASNO